MEDLYIVCFGVGMVISFLYFVRAGLKYNLLVKNLKSLGGAKLNGVWKKVGMFEPPRDIYILTYHQLNRVCMHSYDGENFRNPLTCPVDVDGRPIGFTSGYPKRVITHWMELPKGPFGLEDKRSMKYINFTQKEV